MRTRFCFIIYLAATALLIAACSSTTVVARDDRAAAATSEPTNTPADIADDSSATGDEPAADVQAEAAQDDAPIDDEGDDRGTGDIAADGGPDGFGLGGAEQLGALLVDCEAGSDLACDILFQLSAVDSAEETAAVTCGGRSEVEVVFCTEGVESLSGELPFDPDSDALESIVSQCEDDGDMTACDFLYYRSPVDSTFEDIGATCGGRVTAAVPDCRTLLAGDDDG